MTVNPVATEMLESINHIPASPFFVIKTRYPYTYAYDFTRQHLAKIVPLAIRENMVKAGVLESVEPFISRAEAAGVVRHWAEEAGRSHFELLTGLADAHIIEGGYIWESSEVEEETKQKAAERYFAQTAE